MKAADTSASSAIADWRPLTVEPMSFTTAEIETFMIEVSTTSTNIAIASNSASLLLNGSAGVPPSSGFFICHRLPGLSDGLLPPKLATRSAGQIIPGG